MNEKWKDYIRAHFRVTDRDLNGNFSGDKKKEIIVLYEVVSVLYVFICRHLSFLISRLYDERSLFLLCVRRDITYFFY